MTNPTPLKIITKEVPQSIERDAKFLAMGFVLASILVPTAAIANPAANADELAVTAAMPLVAMYVLGRLMGAFVNPPTPVELAQLKEWREGHGLKRAAFAFAAIVSVMVAFIPVLTFSGAVYYALDMRWATRLALGTLGTTLTIGMLASLAAIVCGVLHHNQAKLWHMIFRLSTSDLRVEAEKVRLLFRSTLVAP